MRKLCSDCKQKKPLNLFYRNKKKSHGRQSKCKQCQKIYHNKVWYPRNRAKVKSRSVLKKRRRRNKHWTIIIKKYFSKGCVDCGIKNVRVLEFDHVRGKKISGVGTMIQDNYGWSTIKKEIDKCEVRCRNCHRLRTFEQFNWHKDIDAFNE